MTEELWVEDDLVGLVIGKSGENLRRVQDASADSPAEHCDIISDSPWNR